jgi:hypothetical protein
LTTILFIQQWVHFWGAATAQSGDNLPERLRFTHGEDMSIQKRNGNFKNIRICNGKLVQVLAELDGALAVQCRRNNGGQVRPPTGRFTYNVSIEIPKDLLGGDGTDPNDGILTLIEFYIPTDQNVTIMQTETNFFVAAQGLTADTSVSILG